MFILNTIQGNIAVGTGLRIFRPAAERFGMEEIMSDDNKWSPELSEVIDCFDAIFEYEELKLDEMIDIVMKEFK